MLVNKIRTTKTYVSEDGSKYKILSIHVYENEIVYEFTKYKCKANYGVCRESHLSDDDFIKAKKILREQK